MSPVSKHQQNFNSLPQQVSTLTRFRPKILAKACLIAAFDSEDPKNKGIETSLTTQTYMFSVAPITRQLQNNQLQSINMHYQHHTIKLTLNSGAEKNRLQKESTGKKIGAQISKSTQMALQADGKSTLAIKGKAKPQLTRDNRQFYLKTTHSKKCHMLICYVHQTQQSGLKNTSSVTYQPKFLSLKLLEARLSNNHCPDIWPQPAITRYVAGKISIPNLTNLPKVLKKNEHFVQTLCVTNTIIVCPTTSIQVQSHPPFIPTKW